MQGNLILGITPDLSGAFAFIGDGVETIPMPVIGNELDLYTISSILAQRASRVKLAVIKQVHALPQVGGPTTFKYGKGFGALEALLVAYQIPYKQIATRRWQKEILAGAPTGIAPRERSLMACRRLFPSVNLVASPRSKVPHEGIVDALLMAEFGRKHA